MMNNRAFIRGFTLEMEKDGVAFLAASAGKALASPAMRSILGKVMMKAGPTVVQAGKSLGGKAMSVETKGGVLGKAVNVASNLGGMADIIRARNPKQPANAGNTITTP